MSAPLLKAFACSNIIKKQVLPCFCTFLPSIQCNPSNSTYCLCIIIKMVNWLLIVSAMVCYGMNLDQDQDHIMLIILIEMFIILRLICTDLTSEEGWFKKWNVCLSFDHTQTYRHWMFFVKFPCKKNVFFI